MRVEEARDLLLDKTEMIRDTETVPLTEAYGRVLAEDVVAAQPVPAFPRSAMDGYALRSADVQGASKDTPIVLKVTGAFYAGDAAVWKEEVLPGTAVKVATGAYVPEGYDAVIMKEKTDEGEEDVNIFASVKSGENYCPPGEDIPLGMKAAEAGEILHAGHGAVLTSLGVKEVKVLRRMQVSIFCTGSELVEAGEPLTPGKIYASTGTFLAMSLKAAGIEVKRCRIIEDTRDKIREALLSAVKDSDMIITTGGVSVGERDLMKAVIAEAGGEVLFHGVDIQPGTPTLGAVLQGVPILALSGNPYAALANFELYFWDAAAKATGRSCLQVKTDELALADPYEKVNRHRRLIRARAEGDKVYLPESVHASSVISNLLHCNCFIDLEAGRKVAVGEKVRVRYFAHSSLQ